MLPLKSLEVTSALDIILEALIDIRMAILMLIFQLITKNEILTVSRSHESARTLLHAAISYWGQKDRTKQEKKEWWKS